MEKHIPVLLKETVGSLNVKENGIYVDLTLGRGGHSSYLLSMLNKDGKLYAFDKDLDAINQAKEVLNKTNKPYEIIRSDFRYFKDELLKRGITTVDGIMADLGVSSPQFDNVERGFSYRNNARLDMRMDQSQSLTAYDVVNTYSLSELTRVFREYGEDKYSYQIAKKIVSIRENKPIETTLQLVDIIKSCKPQKELMKKGHPAKQIFQALRIEVNDELGALKSMLKDALSFLKKNGVLAVITFHSLEDRLVKNAFIEVSKVEGSRHNVFTYPSEDDEPKYKLVNNKVIIATEEELELNPRSASAKLRAIRKVRD